MGKVWLNGVEVSSCLLPGQEILMEHYSSLNYSVIARNFPYHLLIRKQIFDINFVFKCCVVASK